MGKTGIEKITELLDTEDKLFIPKEIAKKLNINRNLVSTNLYTLREKGVTGSTKIGRLVGHYLKKNESLIDENTKRKVLLEHDIHQKQIYDAIKQLGSVEAGDLTKFKEFGKGKGIDYKRTMHETLQRMINAGLLERHKVKIAQKGRAGSGAYAYEYCLKKETGVNEILSSSKNPYERLIRRKQGIYDSAAFVAISNPKFGSDSFSKEAWTNLRSLCQEYDLEMVIVGGIIPQWESFYSKYQFGRRHIKSLDSIFENARNEIGEGEEEKTKNKVITKELRRIKNENFENPGLLPKMHYILGPEDRSNKIEICADKVNILIKGLSKSREVMADCIKEVEKTGTEYERYLREIKSYGESEESFKESRKEAEGMKIRAQENHRALWSAYTNKKRKYGGKNVPPEEKEKLGEIKKKIDAINEKIAKKEKQVDIKSRAKGECEEEEIFQKFKKKVLNTFERLDLKYGNLIYQKTCVESSLKDIDKVILEDNILKYIPLDKISNLVNLFGNVERTTKKTTTKNFIDKINESKKNLEILLNELKEVYPAYSDRVIKRELGGELLNSIENATDKEYERRLKSICSKLEVYQSGSRIEISNGEYKAKIMALTLPRKRIRRTLQGDIQSIFEKMACGNETFLEKENNLDFILLGGHHNLNIQPIVMPNGKITYIAGILPFFDVEKEASNLKESEDTKLASHEGATSGILLADYKESLPRLTPIDLSDIKKVDAIASAHPHLSHDRLEDFILTIMVHGDEHIGKDNIRREACLGLNYLIEDLAKRGLVDLRMKMGDFIQIAKYNEGTREGYFGKPNIERQLNTYRNFIIRGDIEVLKNSSANVKLVWFIGNHPEEDQRQILAAYIKNFLPDVKKEEERTILEKILGDLQEHGGEKNREDSSRIRLIGFESFDEFDLYNNKGVYYGKIVGMHKAGEGGKYKTDPVERNTYYMRSTGLSSFKPRVLAVGHAHVPASGYVKKTNIVQPSSLEHSDRKAAYPTETLSTFGLKIGFPFYYPITFQRLFLPPAGKGPVTQEFISGDFLDAFYDEKIDSEVTRDRETMSNKMFLKLVI